VLAIKYVTKQLNTTQMMLETFDSCEVGACCCGLLGPAEACWSLLERGGPAEACWGVLERAGACWGMLGPARACLELLGPPGAPIYPNHWLCDHCRSLSHPHCGASRSKGAPGRLVALNLHASVSVRNISFIGCQDGSVASKIV
jgi:hypothetical protein